jgi:DNA-binding CsgD family transcriptional regulator
VRTDATPALQRALEDLDRLRLSLWLPSLTYLSDAAAALSDSGAAERLYPELEPHRGTNVLFGHVVSCYGAADRYLGMLAAALGEWDLAEEHFEAAAELNERLGARTWLAHTRYQHARMLLARAGSDDRSRARVVLGEALGLASSIGMSRLVARISALDATAELTQAPADGLTPREQEILRLVAGGLSNREIGRTLFISEHTAASHVRSILRKTGCSNRTEAAAYAHRRGLVEG